MRIFLRALSFYFFLTLFSFTYANVQNEFSFVFPDHAQRFQQLMSELRCLVCQNQSLAESNAPLAQDLKHEVAKQITAGFTDDQIKNYLVQRYGEYILLKPGMSRITLVLWLGPLIFLCGSFLIMYLSVFKKKREMLHYGSTLSEGDSAI